MLLVGLCLQGSITVDAADISNITDNYPYIYWLPDYKSLIVSNTVLGGYTIEDSNGILLRNLDENVYESTNTFTAYLLTIANYQQGDCYTLVYNEVTGWEARQPMMVRKRSVATVYTAPMVTLYSGEKVFTNGQSVPSPYSSGGSTLPDDIPPLDNVEDAINAALNATTSATTEANTIQTNIYNTYNSYATGEITEAEFNTAMAEYQTQLEELANRTTNTLADNVAINNAITYQDLIINQQVNNVSSELTELLNKSKVQMYSFQSYYQNGTYTQSQCIQGVRTQIKVLADLLTSGQYTSAADIEAINAAINYGNTVIEGIANYADLDATVSESANASMESEMAFVDSLLAETTQSLEQLTPQLTDSESTQALQWVGMIWENKFFKMVLPWCGIAMLLCLVLGVKYKT